MDIPGRVLYLHNTAHYKLHILSALSSPQEKGRIHFYISSGITSPSSHDMQHNHMAVTWQGTQLVSGPDPRKAGSGKQGGVEVYTAEC